LSAPEREVTSPSDFKVVGGGGPEHYEKMYNNLINEVWKIELDYE
jgi:hypothetical protein